MAARTAAMEAMARRCLMAWMRVRLRKLEFQRLEKTTGISRVRGMARTR
jgi:hypothetical protein